MSSPGRGAQARRDHLLREGAGCGIMEEVDTTLPEHAHASGRIIPAHFTAQQTRVVRAIRDTDDHIMVRATAGSGKTTTLTEAAWHLPDVSRAVYFVYNKHATYGVAERLPPGLPARTLHAHGMMLLARTGRALDLQGDKTARLLEALHVLPVPPTPASGRYVRSLRFTLIRAWELMRELGLSLRDHDDLALLHELAAWPEGQDVERGLDATLDALLTSPAAQLTFLGSVLRELHEASLDTFESSGLIDHTDMLWLPLQLGLGRGGVVTALVDEAQDLTPLRQAFVTHVVGLRGRQPGRLILCGDPEQAIYAYAGADPQGLLRLARSVRAVELPLSVSFRCPKAVVRAARTVSDFIEAAPGAAEGVVEHVPAASLGFERGDVVLSRLNAPLMTLALDLLSRDVSVHLVGRDLETRLTAAAQEAFPRPFTARDAAGLVVVMFERRAAPLRRAIERGERRAQRQLRDLQDLCRCLTTLARKVSARTPGTADAIRALLARLYSAGGDVTLSTVHKAKGLEWNRVTVLFPEHMPLASGDPEEERCVQFVAFTRARHTLRFAYGEQAWADGLRIGRSEERGERGAEPGDGFGAPVVPDSPARSGPPPEAPRPTRPTAPQGVRRLRPPPEAPLTLSDERELPLFGGPDVLDVAALIDRLGALEQNPRPLVRAWAVTGLAMLSRVPEGTRRLSVHHAALQTIERSARAARLAIPAFGEAGPRGVRVMVFEGGLARWRYGQLNRAGPRVLNVTLDGEVTRFDARTGEPLGTAFAPLGLHLDPAALPDLE